MILRSKKKADNSFTDPVDFVYLWCDDKDSVWHDKMLRYAEQYFNSDDLKMFLTGRYTDHDELKISLRSVEKYLPWINKIFIVTDNQVPEWLDTNNQQIVIVNHKEIIPEKYLPTFNSNVIETYLHHIPGLSEYFLYANDDMFVNSYLSQNFFFTNDKKPIARFRSMRHIEKSVIETSAYFKFTIKMQNWVQKRFGKKIYCEPHHNIDAYTKTICAECEKEFLKEYNICRKNRFRAENDVWRLLIYYYAIAKGMAVLKILHKIDSYLPLCEQVRNFLTHKYDMDSIYMRSDDNDIFEKIKKYNPKLFCINDMGTPEDKFCLSQLHDLFPERSVFEKKEP